ncbi:Vacuolar protein-sorting-associated protein 25 [Cyphellophora attinorum]|uniref:Vacuolar protein-sorting-associated protein 25 n=1 Tax=Cyphellophora attinorum TaxID=1664694 RepID=A0A0N0NQQ0_9EURO|nr:Vacuolar protein-sorting-associated protein 25 [Phialophora attinorum]KPI44171.1 Vacuolar protein-sorting-associated protein 25 [Phialophora attinorum]
MATTLPPQSTQPLAPVEPFTFPSRYSFPPFFTVQPTQSTRQAQLLRWSDLVQRYCRHHKIFLLHLQTALDTPLFHNAALRKRLSMNDARAVIDFMATPSASSAAGTVGGGGDGRAEWLEGSQRGSAWIWWKKPEEWGNLIASWVEETGQKGVVLTLYELVEGETTTTQEFYGLDMRVLQMALQTQVKKGKAQVFGTEDEQGVKFF